MAHSPKHSLPLSSHALSIFEPSVILRASSSDFESSTCSSTLHQDSFSSRTYRRDSFSSRSSADIFDHSPLPVNSSYGAEDVSFDLVNSACESIGLFLNYLIPIKCPTNNKSAFDASTEPKISLPAYFDRIRRYSRISPESSICAVILMRQVCESSQLQLSHLNVHRLMVISLMVFAKYFDDEIDSNGRWARIAGIKKHEINSLEIEFLNRCQFDLKVSPQKFHDMVLELREFSSHPPPFTAQDIISPPPPTETTTVRGIRSFHIPVPSGEFERTIRRSDSRSSCESENASGPKRSIVAFFQPHHHHHHHRHLHYTSDPNSPTAFVSSRSQGACVRSSTPKLPRTVSVQTLSSLFHSPAPTRLFQRRASVACK